MRSDVVGAAGPDNVQTMRGICSPVKVLNAQRLRSTERGWEGVALKAAMGWALGAGVLLGVQHPRGGKFQFVRAWRNNQLEWAPTA